MCEHWGWGDPRVEIQGGVTSGNWNEGAGFTAVPELGHHLEGRWHLCGCRVGAHLWRVWGNRTRWWQSSPIPVRSCPVIHVLKLLVWNVGDGWMPCLGGEIQKMSRQSEVWRHPLMEGPGFPRQIHWNTWQTVSQAHGRRMWISEGK